MFRRRVSGRRPAKPAGSAESAAGMTGLDAEVARCRAALEVGDLTPDDVVTAAGTLGHLLAERFDAAGDRADLDAAIGCFRRALAVAAREDPRRWVLDYALGRALVVRLVGAAEEEGPAMEDAAVACLRAAFAGAAAHGASARERDEVGKLLAVALTDRCERGRGEEPADGDEAIGLLRPLLADGRRAGEHRPRLAAALGLLLLDRTKKTLEQVEFMEATRLLDEALDGIPRGDPARLNIATQLTGAIIAVGSYSPMLAHVLPILDIEIENSARDDPAEFHSSVVGRIAGCVRGAAKVMHFQHTGAQADLDDGIDELRRVLPEFDGARDEKLRRTFTLTLAGGLRMRYAARTDIADLKSAIHHLRSLRARSADDRTIDVGVLNELGSCLVTLGRQNGDPGLADEGVEILRRALDHLPEGHILRGRVLHSLGTALVAGGSTAGPSMATLEQGVVCLRDATAAIVAAGGVMAPVIEGTTGMMLFIAVRDGSHVPAPGGAAESGIIDEILDEAIRMLSRAVDQTGGQTGGQTVGGRRPKRIPAGDSDIAFDPSGPTGMRFRVVLGAALFTRFRRRGVRADLDESIRLLDRCAETVADDPAALFFTAVMMSAADAHRARAALPGLPRRTAASDRETANRLGFATLAGHTWNVLVQSGAEHGLTTARAATDSALALAHWCLVDGSPSDAARALEAGRAMTLHAATADAGIPALLRDAGFGALAAEWERTVPGTPGGHRPTAGREPTSASGGPDPVAVAVAAFGLAGAAGAPGTDVPGHRVGSPVDVPSDLRRRVLRALRGPGHPGTGPGHPGTEGRPGGADGPGAHRPSPTAGLLDAPGPAEIARALARLGADALVYLVPASPAPSRGTRGCAVVVRPAANPSKPDVSSVDLPLLGSSDEGHVARYARIHDGLLTGSGGAAEAGAADRRWRRALDELCSWAGPAVAEPILRHVSGGSPGRRPPRLVVVPVGQLGMVPWHAARVRDDAEPTGYRYPLMDTPLSYAASGRLVCEIARRNALPADGRALVVGNPTGDLQSAQLEAETLTAAFYPDSDGVHIVGPAAPAEPEQVLAALPGGSGQTLPVVHLACHAEAAGRDTTTSIATSTSTTATATATGRVSPARSHLLLGGRRRLEIADIVEQARRRPLDAPGPTVTLSACTTNLTRDSHDEAMTLSTAFVVAGASAVVGSLWEVIDDFSAPLMFMVHFHLRHSRVGCAEALRRAQRWMLDPDRTPPPGMPQRIEGLTRLPQLADPVYWAGFTHQGR
jgi:hypothetical protein